jgi:hypothetical protein
MGRTAGIGPPRGSKTARRSPPRSRADRARLPAARWSAFAGRRIHGDPGGPSAARAAGAAARVEADTRIGVHALEPSGAARRQRSVTPGRSTPRSRRSSALALRAFRALECRDFARADFRLDRGGRPHFLEMNPLPTFAPDGSFGILAEVLGRPLDDLLAEILAEAFVRLGLVARA